MTNTRSSSSSLEDRAAARLIYRAWNNCSKSIAQPPGTPAVDRGAAAAASRVLESEQPVSVTELASRDRAARRAPPRGCVGVLERRGLVEQDGARGRLRPGPAILRVAEREHARAQRRRARAAVARRARGRPAARRSTSPSPAPAASSTSRRSTSRHFLGTGQWIGRRVDYHCTAVGKVFMAFGARDAARRRRCRRTRPATITDPTALASRAATSSAARGYATAIDELEPGLAAIAAPVRGAGGEVVAALSDLRTDAAADAARDRASSCRS